MHAQVHAALCPARLRRTGGGGPPTRAAPYPRVRAALLVLLVRAASAADAIPASTPLRQSVQECVQHVCSMKREGGAPCARANVCVSYVLCAPHPPTRCASSARFLPAQARPLHTPTAACRQPAGSVRLRPMPPAAHGVCARLRLPRVLYQSSRFVLPCRAICCLVIVDSSCHLRQRLCLAPAALLLHAVCECVLHPRLRVCAPSVCAHPRPPHVPRLPSSGALLPLLALCSPVLVDTQRSLCLRLCYAPAALLPPAGCVCVYYPALCECVCHLDLLSSASHRSSWCLLARYARSCSSTRHALCASAYAQRLPHCCYTRCARVFYIPVCVCVHRVCAHLLGLLTSQGCPLPALSFLFSRCARPCSPTHHALCASAFAMRQPRCCCLPCVCVCHPPLLASACLPLGCVFSSCPPTIDFPMCAASFDLHATPDRPRHTPRASAVATGERGA